MNQKKNMNKNQKEKIPPNVKLQRAPCSSTDAIYTLSLCSFIKCVVDTAADGGSVS